MILVTRAILIQNGCFLAAQRPVTMSLPLKWELPGGKLEEDELPEAGLLRETLEEFGLAVRIVEGLEPVDHFFRDRHYRMLPFVCEVTGGTLEVFEHAQARWIAFDQAHTLDWAPTEGKIIRKWLGLEEAAEATVEALEA